MSEYTLKRLELLNRQGQEKVIDYMEMLIDGGRYNANSNIVSMDTFRALKATEYKGTEGRKQKQCRN